MAERKKLAYRDVPHAIVYVFKTLWRFSPSYVLLTIFSGLKERLVPFATLFIAAAVTSRLPGLIHHEQSYRSVLSLAAILITIELISRSLDLLLQNTMQRQEAQVTIRLRQYFYESFARLPYYKYEDKDVIDSFQYADNFMYRFSQFGLIQITRAAGAFIELVIATLALWTVAWYLPLMMVVSLPILIRSFLRINKQQATITKENQTQQRRIWAIENLFYPRKIKETRLYGIVSHMLGERRDLMEHIRVREYQVERTRNYLRLKQQFVSQLIELISMATALWKIAYHGAPIGIFVLAQQLTSRAASAAESLFNDLVNFDKDLYGFAEYRYITEDLQPPVQADKKQVSQKPSISLHDVNFIYPHNTKKVLAGVDLDIPYGTSLAIVGENGAGKTTLIRLILGLYLPSKGAISINNQDLSEYIEASWLSKVGVLIQDYGINEDMTIRDTVWLGNVTQPRNDKKIWAALEQAEMTDTIKELPHQLDTFLGKWIDEEKGVELSGGQLQRLAIARALFRDPEILILDEPTSSIDANAEERIFQKLMSARKGKTTIFISHRFSTVRRAEQIIFMQRGRIIESGTHEELMAGKGAYHTMFTAQSKAYK